MDCLPYNTLQISIFCEVGQKIKDLDLEAIVALFHDQGVPDPDAIISKEIESCDPGVKGCPNQNY